MARIAGVDLPREKRVEIGLTYIFGIGLATSKQILAETEINPDTRVKDLSENDVSKLREYIEHHVKVEGAPARAPSAPSRARRRPLVNQTQSMLIQHGGMNKHGTQAKA